MRAALGKFIPVLLGCSSLGCSRNDDIDRTDTTKGVPILSFHSLQPDRSEEDLYSAAELKLSNEPDEILGKPLSLEAFIKDQFLKSSYAKREPQSFVIKSGDLPITELIESALRGHLQEKVKHRLYTVTPVRDAIEPDQKKTGIECGTERGVWFVKVGAELHALWIDIVFANMHQDAVFFASISPNEDDSWRSESTEPSTLAYPAEETQDRTMHNWIHETMKRKAVGVRWAEVYGSKSPGTEEYEWKATPIKYFVIRPNSAADQD